MSSTPPKKDGVEPAQSPDEEHPMDRNAEETQAQGLGYEFEVKEQDRWLPIANGALLSPSTLRRFDLRVVLFPSARQRIALNRRPWMSTCPPIARLSRLRVESQPLPKASHSRASCAWKTADLQPPSCRPLLHIPPLRRHSPRPRAPPTVLHQTLTFVTLLQSPAS
jgi:hypothetical protein